MSESSQKNKSIWMRVGKKMREAMERGGKTERGRRIVGNLTRVRTVRSVYGVPYGQCQSLPAPQKSGGTGVSAIPTVQGPRKSISPCTDYSRVQESYYGGDSPFLRVESR